MRLCTACYGVYKPLDLSVPVSSSLLFRTWEAEAVKAQSNQLAQLQPNRSKFFGVSFLEFNSRSKFNTF